MSPINRKKLNILRKRLDLLDNKLLDIIKKRENLVSNVLYLKKNRSEIVDKKRIKEILKNIKKKSIKKKIDTRTTNKIWKNMINSFIEYERRTFKK
jgi:chorismate mutase